MQLIRRGRQYRFATAKPDAIPLCDPAGHRRRFEAIRSGYGGLQLALGNRGKVIAGFLGYAGLVRACSLSRPDFFPTVDGGQIRCMCGRKPARIEETGSPTGSVAIHQIIPTDELDGIVDNIGLSVGGINMAYNNSRTIGVGDADILVSLKPNHAPTADYVRTMRELLPRQFRAPPSLSCRPTWSARSSISACPRVDLRSWRRSAGEREICQLLARIKLIPGIAMRASSRRSSGRP
jgi:hypothetical protein